MRGMRLRLSGAVFGAACLAVGFAGGNLVKRGVVEPTPLPNTGAVSLDGTTNPAALARSNALVDQAVASHAWKTAQAEEFHPLVLQLSAEDRDAVMRRLFRAVNAGRVIIDTATVPF